MDADTLYTKGFKQKEFVYKTENELFRVEPPRLILDWKHKYSPPRKTVRIVNRTDTSQKCYVLPLESKQFYAIFRNMELIAPGLSMPVEVALNPEAYDDTEGERAWLKIYCYGAGNLMIPVETADPNPPFINEIPKLLDFGNVPLCENSTYKIAISPNPNESDISNVTILEPHEDVTLFINKGKTSFVEVTYTPTSYTTMRFSMIIYPATMKKDYPVVVIVGRCMPPPYQEVDEESCPGVIPKIPKSDLVQELQNELTKKKKMYLLNEPVEKFPKKKKVKESDIEKDQEFRSPRDDLSQLRGPLGRTVEEDKELKKLVDEEFNNEVAEFKKRSTEVHIRPDLENLGMGGDDVPKHNYDVDWDFYTKLRGYIIDDKIMTANEPQLLRQRIIKRPENTPESKISQPEMCCEWVSRFHPHSRLIQGVRRVMVRNRLRNRLAALKESISEMQRQLLPGDTLCYISSDTEPQTVAFFGSAFQFPLPLERRSSEDVSVWGRYPSTAGEMM